jgi:tRNA-2-methylthio-N6-dimethylallyladenosine synthase
MTTHQQKTYFMRTYGCQMNELDTEVAAGILESMGFNRTQDDKNANLVLLNTCSIRDLAERKAFGKLGILSLKKKPNTIIGVMGCMANAKKDRILEKLPSVDFVIGTNNIHELKNVVDEVSRTKQSVVKVDRHFYEELDYTQAKRSNPYSAYVSIIRGCNKYCTYCVVPYTRGKEVSRSHNDIIEEVKKLVDDGTKEITLLGQNVNSYGKDFENNNYLFHDLLADLDRIDGLQRIRFMTSHPVDITQELMFAIRDLPSACEFIHFPMQSGSQRILKKMHRIYTIEQYLEKVNMLKSIVPNAVLGTDIIVGFPTEMDADFQETYRHMKEIEYGVAFIFAFSKRKGTPAARWHDDIPEEVKQARLQSLLKLQDNISAKQRQAMLGTNVELLIEKVNQKNSNLIQGRTRCWKNAIVKGNNNELGSTLNVKVEGVNHQTLICSRVD